MGKSFIISTTVSSYEYELNFQSMERKLINYPRLQKAGRISTETSDAISVNTFIIKAPSVMRSDMRALLARMEHKNGWQMAEYLGDKSPHTIQNFLSRAAWDAGKVRGALIQYAKNHLLSDEVEGVLIADETGFLKKESHSAGAARQYSGTAGRIENRSHLIYWNTI